MEKKPVRTVIVGIRKEYEPDDVVMPLVRVEVLDPDLPMKDEEDVRDAFARAFARLVKPGEDASSLEYTEPLDLLEADGCDAACESVGFRVDFADEPDIVIDGLDPLESLIDGYLPEEEEEE